MYFFQSNKKCFYVNTVRIWSPMSMCDPIFESPEWELSNGA